MKSSTTLSFNNSNKPVIDTLGIHLSGPKTGKTAVTWLRSHKGDKKSYVLDIFFPLASDENDLSDDDAFLEFMQGSIDVQSTILALDICLQEAPTVITNGKVTHHREQLEWMEAFYQSQKAVNSKLKPPTTYFQRPSDLYLRYILEIEPFEPGSSNHAPRFLRWKYLRSQIEAPLKILEVYPKHSIRALSAIKTSSARLLGTLRDVHERGTDQRRKFINMLQDLNMLFIKEAHLELAAENVEVFDSLLCAITAKCVDEGFSLRAPHEALEEAWPALLDESQLKKFFAKS